MTADYGTFLVTGTMGMGALLGAIGAMMFSIRSLLEMRKDKEQSEQRHQKARIQMERMAEGFLGLYAGLNRNSTPQVTQHIGDLVVLLNEIKQSGLVLDDGDDDDTDDADDEQLAVAATPPRDIIVSDSDVPGAYSKLMDGEGNTIAVVPDDADPEDMAELERRVKEWDRRKRARLAKDSVPQKPAKATKPKTGGPVAKRRGTPPAAKPAVKTDASDDLNDIMFIQSRMRRQVNVWLKAYPGGAEVLESNAALREGAAGGVYVTDRAPFLMWRIKEDAGDGERTWEFMGEAHGISEHQ